MEEVKKFAETVQPYWAVVEPVLTVRTEADYVRAVARLNALLDEVGDDATHPLYSLLDTLGTLIRAYEDEHMSMPKATGVEALQYLMEEHDLTQSDLPEVGSQGVVSEILRGKRRLNIRQIQALAERFHVSPAVFI
ncbi:MAG TPA: transcriptional regulator [Chloroflexi bacterium]|nr:transcriptional regulator [Chloroflexota bacterium]HHW89152.1 helix-turn-helix domain-containing protein [Chloroflexota bacterium]